MNTLRELYKNKTIKNKLDVLFDEAVVIESSFNVGKGLNFLLLKNNNKLIKKYYYSNNNNKVNNIFNIIK
uniref:Uncharacterized protein n=1 Tax=Acrasis kona TaxID=1008807 RepID=A0A0B4MZ24_9EUKA|nr:hypothetical protein [Acrasis kona]AID52059.1 hypothetical protein [Acrasis kona]